MIIVGIPKKDMGQKGPKMTHIPHIPYGAKRPQNAPLYYTSIYNYINNTNTSICIVKTRI